MKLAALQHELTCECCAQELDILHDVIRLSDVSIAKVLMISEVAQIARSEMRMRDYLLGKWRLRATEAAARAGAVVSGGGNLTSAYAAVDKVMGKWAGEVEARAGKDLENVYYLARKAGWKKGTGQTKASLQYVVPNFTEEIEAVQKAKRKAATVLPSFDLLDEKAVDTLQRDQMLWIGRHYDANLREAVREAVKPGMIAGRGHDKIGPIVRDAVQKTLGKVVVPEGFSGSDAKYFEGIAANVSTNARVSGQIRSFKDIGITKYEIVNPMDERTTPICRHMNGKVFEVKDAEAQLKRTAAATTPEGVKQAHPWLSLVKVQAIKGSKGLAKAGLALPPYHFRCRSTVDVSVESMSFESLKPEAPEPVAPKQPKAKTPKQVAAPAVATPKPAAKKPVPAPKPEPSKKLGDMGERIFGKKLTDADIGDLLGAQAKLPKGHKLAGTTAKELSIGDGVVRLNGSVVNKKGESVGGFSRLFYRQQGDLIAKNFTFFLSDQAQGSGIGKAIFNAQIDAYERAGISKVSLDASMVGRYVWTKAGFNWESAEQIAQLREALREKLLAKLDAKAANKILSTVVTPEDVARVVVGKERVGKDLLLNFAEEQIPMMQTPKKIKRL